MGRRVALGHLAARLRAQGLDLAEDLADDERRQAEGRLVVHPTARLKPAAAVANLDLDPALGGESADLERALLGPLVGVEHDVVAGLRDHGLQVVHALRRDAKRLAEEAGVPVAPWSGGPVDDLEQARRPLAASPPDVAHAPLLPDARLVLEKQAQALVFMRTLNFFQRSPGSF